MNSEKGHGPRSGDKDGRWLKDGDGRRPMDGDGRRLKDGDGRRPMDGDGRRLKDGDGRRPMDGDGRRLKDGNGRRPGGGGGPWSKVKGVLLLYAVWASVILVLVVPAMAEDPADDPDAGDGGGEGSGGGDGSGGDEDGDPSGTLGLIVRNLPLFAGAAAVISYLAIFGYFAAARRKDGLRREALDEVLAEKERREPAVVVYRGTRRSERLRWDASDFETEEAWDATPGIQLVRGRRRTNGEGEAEPLRSSRRMRPGEAEMGKSAKEK